MKNNLKLILSLVVLAIIIFTSIFIFPNKSTKEDTTEYKKITGEEAKALMEENENDIILDVRTPEEYEEAHIEGAVLIPDNELYSKVENKIPDKDSLILVYCRSGRRSAASAMALIEMGYTNVYDFGGIIDYPYETVSD